MTRILVEAAIDSVESAERAVREGAGRLEVCADLSVGGLTPSRDRVDACLTLVVPCVAMARERAGDFVYSPTELRAIDAAARALCDTDVAGIVFGALSGDGLVDAAFARSIVQICAGKDVVFHRAFDRTPDPFRALDSLIDCRVTRVLTSGHAASAFAGVSELTELVARSAGRIQILPGGGVRANNALTIVEQSGVREVHARGTEPGVIAAIVTALP